MCEACWVWRAAYSGKRPGEVAAQQIAAAKQPRLDRAFGYAKRAGGGSDILLVKVKEEDGVAVFGGKSEDSAAEGFVAGGILEGAAGDARIRWLSDFVEREHGGGDAAEFGAVEIGCEREEPGGKGGVAAELGEIAPGAEEGFLGHFLGAGAVAAEAPRKIDERRLPAADDALEGGCVAGKNAGDDGFVGGVGLGLRSRSHIALCRYDLE